MDVIKVGQRFNRATQTYQAAATVQSQAALELAKTLASLNVPCGSWLEIGAGTGLVTNQVLRWCAPNSLKVTDLASSMVAQLAKELPSQVALAVLDASAFAECNHYACIYSGCALQWVPDLEQTLLNLLKGTIPGGWLAFSFVEAGSFPEWRKTCIEEGIACTMNPLPDSNTVQNVFSQRGYQVKMEKRSYRLQLPSARDFFAHLKHLGATAPTVPTPALSVADFRHLLRALDCRPELTMTYEIAFCTVQNHV